MKTLSLTIALIITLSFTNTDKGLTVGENAPKIALPNIENKTVELSSLEGKVVLVTFWASWCRYCKNDITQTLIPLYEKYRNQGFEIYSVSLDENAQNWSAFSSANKINWTNVIDPGGFKSENTIKYGIERVPQNFLINKDGQLIAKDLKAKDLESEIKELLN